MEMQAVSRVVRLGQTEMVKLVTPYIQDTVDDKHKMKHSSKSEQSKFVTGDVSVDDMYINEYDLMEEFENNFVDLSQDD